MRICPSEFQKLSSFLDYLILTLLSRAMCFNMGLKIEGDIWVMWSLGNNYMEMLIGKCNDI